MFLPKLPKPWHIEEALQYTNKNLFMFIMEKQNMILAHLDSAPIEKLDSWQKAIVKMYEEMSCPKCGKPKTSSNMGAACICGIEVQTISIKCPDCFEGLYRVTKPGGSVPAGQCETCDGTGIQQDGLSKKQARLALDEGWIVEYKSLDSKVGGYWVKHSERIYFKDQWFSKPMEQVWNHLKINTFSIKCRAVEIKENLKTWEAFKLQREGWEIIAYNGTSYKWYNGWKQLTSTGWQEIKGYFLTPMQLSRLWTATKTNYPIPKEQK